VDTWVSPVPASVAPPARGDETPLPGGLDARSAARAIAEPSVRVLAGRAERADVEAADSSTAFVVGALLDSRYRILRFVGRGGMGEVYEAHDQLMDRHVGLKTILRSVADRSRAARRFKAEVRNAQRVAHPHVCRIHDLHEHHDGGSEAPLPFFTMELIDGERLAQRLLGAALPLEDTRHIALQLLDGLAAAHARGVLHLDFKSDNVMLRRGTSRPEATIMDFGLSRVHGDSGGLLTSDRRQFAGTLPYMSIEQLECRESLGPTSDVYAFGVVLYEMLTRALPFEGESLGTLLMKQLSERPTPPSRRVPGLSHAVDRFVLRCLAREPRERFSDAGAALAALSAIGPWAPPRSAFARWRVAWPAAALLFAGGVLLWKRSPEPPAAAAQRELEQQTTRLEPWAQASSRDPALDVVVPTVAAVGAATTVATALTPPPAAMPATSPERFEAAADPSGQASVTTSTSAALGALAGGAVTPGAVSPSSTPAAPPALATSPRPSEAGLAASPDSTQQRAAPSPAPADTPRAVSVEPAAEGSAGVAPSWTPTRVPKRLSRLGAGTAPTATPLGAPPLTPASRDDDEPPPAPDGAQNRPR